MHIHNRPPKHPGLSGDNTLHVVSVISNPVRFASRYRLFEEFSARMMSTPNINFVVVELAFGDRHHEVTLAGNHSHVRVHAHSELWHKENLINIGIRSLPRDWQYVAWIDGDVQFVNPDWAQETLHQLQHYDVLQLFETAIDMGPRNNVMQVHTSFAKLYATGAPLHVTSDAYYGLVKAPGPYWHPGYAWACTRRLYENVGGLIDKAIIGAGDHHMALSIIGNAKMSLPGGLNPSYDRMVYDWQKKAQIASQGNLGYVEGSLIHYWHGPKKARKYIERWDLVRKNDYDPDHDVHYTKEGVLELKGNKPQLRNDLRSYFRNRNEDSIDE